MGHGERVKTIDLFESDSWNVIYATGEEDF